MLIAAALFNFAAALPFAFPTTFGQPAALPAGEASLLLMLGGLGDLAFAAMFFWWLRASGLPPSMGQP